MNKLGDEYKILQNAQKFSKGSYSSNSQKTTKLLKKVIINPDFWLETYNRFGDLHWAVEIFNMGLDENEQEAVVQILEKSNIKGIQLNSDEGYKALSVSGVKNVLKISLNELENSRRNLERKLNSIFRYHKQGVIISGYKKGLPFTTYVDIQNGNYHFHHKVYLDSEGYFEQIERVSESLLFPDDTLRECLSKIEKNITFIVDTWVLWQKTEIIKERLENLEKYSDAEGAFSQNF